MGTTTREGRITASFKKEREGEHTSRRTGWHKTEGIDTHASRWQERPIDNEAMPIVESNGHTMCLFTPPFNQWETDKRGGYATTTPHGLRMETQGVGGPAGQGDGKERTPGIISAEGMAECGRVRGALPVKHSGGMTAQRGRGDACRDKRR